ncbi:MAG: hypothetical protein E7Y34_03015, partial [Mycoplasma sp.]|nr:hypothetical protein [Mycoplasma sp.]
MEWYDKRTGNIVGILSKERHDFDGNFMFKYHYGKTSKSSGWIPFQFKLSKKTMFYKFVYHLDDKLLKTLTYKFDYHFNPRQFVKDLENELELHFIRNGVPKDSFNFNILDRDKIEFALGEDKSISV